MTGRLWKRIPPFLSDVLGMQAVLDLTGGIGVVDDSSRYKPLERGTESRVWNSEIRNADVVYGTERKVLDVCKKMIESQAPDFLLLCHAPSSAMIGSDLNLVLSQIEEQYDTPAAVVAIDGEKDYLHGISLTLEAMGELLLKEEKTIPGSVNLLGCNSIDWTEEMLAETEAWVKRCGYSVLSRWGMRESTEALRHAAAASLNLVVSTAGLKLAEYMKREFGIRYVVGAPFGSTHCAWIQAAMLAAGHVESAGIGCDVAPWILVTGEQLLGNAIRRTLYVKGYEAVKVASFFPAVRGQMSSCDEYLTGEAALEKLLEEGKPKLVIGSPNYRGLCRDSDIAWIDLPDRACILSQDGFVLNLVGDRLDHWLDRELARVGFA